MPCERVSVGRAEVTLEPRAQFCSLCELHRPLDQRRVYSVALGYRQRQLRLRFDYGVLLPLAEKVGDTIEACIRQHRIVLRAVSCTGEAFIRKRGRCATRIHGVRRTAY